MSSVYVKSLLLLSAYESRNSRNNNKKQGKSQSVSKTGDCLGFLFLEYTDEQRSWKMFEGSSLL